MFANVALTRWVKEGSVFIVIRMTGSLVSQID